MSSGANSESEDLTSLSNPSAVSPAEISPSERVEICMALSEECQKFISSYLPQGFNLHNQCLSETYTEKEIVIEFTVLYKNCEEVKRFLFHISNLKAAELNLEEIRSDSTNTLRSIRDLILRENKSVFYIYMYVVYRDPPHFGYKVLMETEWTEMFDKIKKVEFIHYVYMSNQDAIEAKLMTEGRPIQAFPKHKFWEQQKDNLESYLIKMLDLDIEEQISASSKSLLDPLQMEGFERERVIEIIMGRQFFENERGRKVFIQNQISLKKEFESFDFSGPKNTVAWELLDKLLELKKLGRLLMKILNQSDLPSDDKSFLETLVGKYSLPKN